MDGLDVGVAGLVALSVALVRLDGLVRPAAMGVFLATATLTFYGLRRYWQTQSSKTRCPTCAASNPDLPDCDEMEAAP